MATEEDRYGLPMPYSGERSLSLREWNAYHRRQKWQHKHDPEYVKKWRRPGTETSEAVWKILAAHGLHIETLLPPIYQRITLDEKVEVDWTIKQALVLALDAFVEGARSGRTMTLNRIFDILALNWSDHFLRVAAAGRANRARDMLPATVRAARRDLVRNGIDCLAIWDTIACAWSEKAGQNPLYWTERIGVTEGRRVVLKFGDALADFERHILEDRGHERLGLGWLILPADAATPPDTGDKESCGEVPYNVIESGSRAKNVMRILERARLNFNAAIFRENYLEADVSAQVAARALKDSYHFDATLSNGPAKLTASASLPLKRQQALKRVAREDLPAVQSLLAFYDSAWTHCRQYEAAYVQTASMPDEVVIRTHIHRQINRRYQAANLWPMATSGRIDRINDVVAVVPAEPQPEERKGRELGGIRRPYTIVTDSSMRGRWFRFVTADPENPLEDPYTLLGMDVSASQTTILAVLLGLKELEDIASKERFNAYLARRAWERRTTLLNITGAETGPDADYVGPEDTRLVELVKQLWMRVLYGAPTAWTVIEQWKNSEEVGPGWRKGTQKGHITRAAVDFLKSIPRYKDIAKFLKACRRIASRVDRYRGFEFTDPFDQVVVRWNPVARVDTYPSSSGLKLLVSRPGSLTAKSVNRETLETNRAKQIFHAPDPITGDYPIDRKELGSMIAPCLTHALDAAFAGCLVEQLDQHGASDIVIIHDAFFTNGPIKVTPEALIGPLETALEPATQEWFKSLGSVYTDLLKYLGPLDRTFRPMLETAHANWQRRVNDETWPQFFMKTDDPAGQWRILKET